MQQHLRLILCPNTHVMIVQEQTATAHRNVLQQRHLTEDLNVSQLVKVEVPFSLDIVNLQLQFCDLRIGRLVVKQLRPLMHA